jgi:hypothetical protein
MVRGRPNNAGVFLWLGGGHPPAAWGGGHRCARGTKLLSLH